MRRDDVVRFRIGINGEQLVPSGNRFDFFIEELDAAARLIARIHGDDGSERDVRNVCDDETRARLFFELLDDLCVVAREGFNAQPVTDVVDTNAERDERRVRIDRGSELSAQYIVSRRAAHTEIV